LTNESTGSAVPAVRRASPPGATAPPRLLAAVAAVVLAVSACSSGGGPGPDNEDGPERPTGPADELTAVDPAEVPGVEERTDGEDDGDVAVDVAYPAVPGADPLTERLGEITAAEVSDFTGANPGAKRISVDWGLSAAAEDVVAVRLVQREEDSEGERTGYATYWYDTGSGHTAYATELIADQAGLADLNGLVRERLADTEGVDPDALQPVLRVYDSMGFNPDGDLVVEFDAGQVAPVKEGRVSAVVPRADAEPLLSEFGVRARDAATVVERGFAVASPAAAAPKDGPAEGVPGLLPERDPDLDCTAPDSKCLALTFDDGPGERTPELLDALAEHDAKATFFVTGGPVREHPETVRRTYAEGHELGNHTVEHPDLARLGKGAIREELDTVDDLVRRETGADMSLMRPPYGSTDDQVEEVAADLGHAQIIWSVDTNDWKDRKAGVVVDRVVDGAEPGAIILMHDIHGSTVDAVPRMLEKLDEKGYTMVTVSQLLGDTEPGRAYYDAPPERPEDAEDGGGDQGD
jgi:peptidoglycan/xylan/chitin deacetylase (PgdA/CDA1 family)